MTDSSKSPDITPGTSSTVGITSKVPPGVDVHLDGDAGLDTEFKRGLGLFSATMVVAGSMIGSGIFIVSVSMSQWIGSPGWLLVAWVITGVLTVTAALSYGELAAMMPRAGGQYVYLREAFSPLWGFLYGWTLFLVIQTGTIAAVGVGFAKFAGVFFPGVSLDNYLIGPYHLPGISLGENLLGPYYLTWDSGYAFSLTTGQLVGILLIVLLTLFNMAGIDYGKIVQNVFTVAKVGALVALIVLGLTLGWQVAGAGANFNDLWTPRPSKPIVPGLTAVTVWGLLVALAVSQTQSLFSADAWNNITFTAGEVRQPRRTIPLSLALGTGLVILLYLLANVTYLVVLPFSDIQKVPEDRIGTATLQQILGENGVYVMAAAIMVSTFGCTNGLILAGARAYYAMARDGLFFRPTARLNRARVPAWGLAIQCLWACLLILPRTYELKDGKLEYGNLYSDLLEYIISAALLFYVLTILGIFVLRVRRPDAPRPYRAFGYPVVPALYIAGATALFVILFIYRTKTTWPGLVLVLIGVPVYYMWSGRPHHETDPPG
jgi:APA family basic amino acid/polyamine antiporter